MQGKENPEEKRNASTRISDKQQIKSHIKHLPRRKNFGVADDFPKEVDEIRKELYPVLKQAKREHKTAFFNVEKLIIDKAVYRGPETKKLHSTVESWTLFNSVYHLVPL